MKRLFLALLFVLLAFNGVAFAGDGSDYRQLQETGVFYNMSGGTLTAGTVVILDTSSTTAGTTLGAHVTTTTSADSVLVVGVVSEQNSCAASTPCIVVTKGPVDTYVNDSTDAVTINTAVGTTTTAGRAGGGTNLGVALEAGGGTDGEKVIVWVNPTGAD